MGPELYTLPKRRQLSEELREAREERFNSEMEDAKGNLHEIEEIRFE